MKVKSIIGFVGGRCKGDFSEQKDWEAQPRDSSTILGRVYDHLDSILHFLKKPRDRRSFDEVERELVGLVFALGRLLLAFYCAWRNEHSQEEVAAWERRGYRPRRLERKYLATFFGRITVWRKYLRRPGGDGVHPLDLALGLTADGFSFLVMEMCARLSTVLVYEQVTAFLLYFLGWSPSKTSVEKAVLGFGRYTQEWFESAPPPEGDGEILVIQIDCKATPTATAEELEKRRGKREKTKKARSPRHRRREKRKRLGPTKRRTCADRSKNGKAATVVVMYTLKKDRDDSGEWVLDGPINKRHYGSYAPKRHAFAVAEREARKRGFDPQTSPNIQIITDGDTDFTRYVKEFFPHARHTLDIYHVLEYFWQAGRLCFEEGSPELHRWVKDQERRLYNGKAHRAVQHLCDLDRHLGPKAKKELFSIRRYLVSRMHMMNYGELRELDLDVGSGVVEGAVRHIVAKRFDCGSMRWIRERAEALLQLRCIEINGDWEAFTVFVKAKVTPAKSRDPTLPALLTNKPAPLPAFGVTNCKICA